MRILVVAGQWFPDHYGGVARVAADTARHLAARGHEVVVVAPSNESRPAVTSEGPVLVRRALPRSRLPRALSDLGAAALEGRRLSSERFDVVLAHTATASVGLLASGVRAPMVYVYHASAPRELRDMRLRLSRPVARLKTYPLVPLLVLYQHIVMRRAARVLVLSEFSRSLLAEDHPFVTPRVRLVSGGVDTEAFKPDGGQETARARLRIEPRLPLVLTVRRLEPRMGLDQLLRAVRLLEQRQPIELALIGGGSLDSQLRRLAGELGVEHRIRFLGKVPDGELLDWYRAADLFVLPTLSYEGFGMVTAEALATGTPVVGTPVGATPELLLPLDPGLLTAGTEPDQLADGIDAALEATGDGLRQRCLEYARSRLSWEVAIESWEAVLAETAAASRPT